MKHFHMISTREHLNSNKITHHSFIPDQSHPLLHSVDALWNLSEVVLANGLLGHAEGTVSTASYAKVSTGKYKNMKTHKSV